MADQHYVMHSHKESANLENGAQVNMAEAINSQAQRALVGIHFNLGCLHLQRYLFDIVWRWNHRQPVFCLVNHGPRKRE